jgi:hypothetical protein
VDRIHKLVLRDMPLPPIFRLAAQPHYVYISADARRALGAAGIRGVDYLRYDFVA